MPDADLPIPPPKADNDALPASLGMLCAAQLPASIASDIEDWSPECALPPSLWEIFGSHDDAGGDGLALAFAGARLGAGEPPQWLWVQDSESIRRSGRPCLHGLPEALRPGLLHVETRHGADALWAMEEGVRCGALSFVIGEISGDPKALDFTATRRLVLAAERSGVPLTLIRRDGHPNLSAARLRWRAGPAPSSAHQWDRRAPGQPHVAAELFRGRGFKPGRFLLAHGVGSHDPGDRLALAAQLRDRPVEPDYSVAG